MYLYFVFIDSYHDGLFVILLNRIEGVSCLMSKLHMTYYMESSWEKNFFIF